jgi:hypothetical protein
MPRMLTMVGESRDLRSLMQTPNSVRPGRHATRWLLFCTRAAQTNVGVLVWADFDAMQGLVAAV